MSAPASEEALRRESLRRQLALMDRIRDEVEHASEDDYEAWAVALAPVSDRITHELMRLEGVPPYPYPMGAIEWYVPAVETP